MASPGAGQGDDLIRTSPDLTARWELAYDHYRRASEWARRAPENPDAAKDMARTSWEIAELWRALTGVPGLAWWMVSALRTAANAFDTQAMEWHERATRPPARPPMLPRLFIEKQG